MGILGDIMPAIGGIVGAGLGMINQGAQDKRQLEQQKKLQELQIKGGKEMSEFQNEQQYNMWLKTNVGAQKRLMKEAGLNPALMYGQGGGGGATTGGGGGAMPTGASAGDPNAGAANMMQMGMQLAQMKVLESQARKNNVEADKQEGVDTEKGKQDIKESQARVTGQEFQNKMNELYGQDNANVDWSMKQVSKEEQNLKWEMYKAIAWESGNVEDKGNTAAKSLKASFDKAVIDLQNARKEGRLLDAKTTIENFGAQMAKDGLAPNTPWYIKTIDTLLNKAGIHILK